MIPSKYLIAGFDFLNHLGEIQRISAAEIALIAQVETSGIDNFDIDANLNPVPLNDDRLSKLGFAHTGNKFTLNGFALKSTIDSGVYDVVGMQNQVTYMHELQLCYRAAVNSYISLI